MRPEKERNKRLLRLRRLRRLCLLLLLSLGLTWMTAGAEDPPVLSLTEAELQGITPFGTVVRRNWARWSRGSPAVTKTDLIARIAGSEDKGEDAAALAALETYLRKTPSVDGATAAAIADSRIVTLYHANVLKLRRAQRTLFANGRPTFELLPPGQTRL